MKLYEMFKGNDLNIAELIQQRRLQMMVHSYIYYELDKNLVSDFQWAKWAKELEQLQLDYPLIAQQVIYADDFKNWDGSSGAYLHYNDDHIISVAKRLLGEPIPQEVQKQAPKKNPQQMQLF